MSGWRSVTVSACAACSERGFATLTVGHSTNSFGSDAWDKDLAGQMVERNRSRESETTAKGDLTLRLPHGGWLKARRWRQAISTRHSISACRSASRIPTRSRDERVNEVRSTSASATGSTAATCRLSQRLGSLLTLSAGGRYDRFPLNGESVFSPRAGLVLHLLRNLDLTASWGRYAQNAPLVFMQASRRTPKLRPIRAEHYVGGLGCSPGKDLKLSVEAYAEALQRYPVSTRVSLPDHGRHRRAVRRLGMLMSRS